MSDANLSGDAAYVRAIAQLLPEADVFLASGRVPCMRLGVGGATLPVPVTSRLFRRWLAFFTYSSTGLLPHAADLDRIVEVIAGYAQSVGRERDAVLTPSDEERLEQALTGLLAATTDGRWDGRPDELLNVLRVWEPQSIFPWTAGEQPAATFVQALRRVAAPLALRGIDLTVRLAGGAAWAISAVDRYGEVAAASPPEDPFALLPEVESLCID